MNGFLKQDLGRSMINPGFFAGVAFVLAILLPAAIFDSPMDGSRSFLNAFGNIFHASGFAPFAAVFPVLAYSTTFCEEYGQGYFRMILHRTGFARFARVRMLTVAFSGGLMIAAPVEAVCLIAYAGSAHGIPTGSDEGLLAGTKIMEAVIKYGDWYVLTGKFVLAFLFGALWALVGLIFAVWIPNRYVGLLAPFILYETLWLFLGYVPYNPVFLLSGEGGLSAGGAHRGCLYCVYGSRHLRRNQAGGTRIV